MKMFAVVVNAKTEGGHPIAAFDNPGSAWEWLTSPHRNWNNRHLSWEIENGSMTVKEWDVPEFGK